MRNWQRLVLTALPVLVFGTGVSQSKPDFSGSWSIATDQTAGCGARPGTARARPVGYLSGGAFNCMTACRIVQNVETLTISRPPDQNGLKAPPVVLYLDGRESTIVDSFNSRRVQFSANARWHGDTLVITHSMGRLTITQTLALDRGRLTVVNDYGLEPETLTYVRN